MQQNDDEPQKNTKTIRKLWIAIGILALLSPLGLIIPALLGAGGAWGEWGLDEINKMFGFVPEGMKKLGHVWNSPMKDYAVPGYSSGMAQRGLGYAVSALIGVALAAFLAFIFARILAKRGKGNRRE